MLLDGKFEEAFVFANRLHAKQYRKGTNTPYVSHLLAVASLVLEHGGTEDEAIAALLHDAVEDQDVCLKEISDRFGRKVAAIVEECSDSVVQPKPPWKERKTSYLNAIPGKSKSAQLVTMADKLHNARSILIDYRRVGDCIWDRFTGGKEGTLWYYRILVERFLLVQRHPLAIELEYVVSELEKLLCE